MPTLIRGASVFAAGGFMKRGDVLIDGRKIRRIAERIAAPKARVIDAKGLIAAPGLIDIHINGGFGRTFSEASPEEIREVGKRLLAHGVTSYVASFISLPRETILAGIGRVKAAMKLDGAARILGVHLEGPFLSPERHGAHRVEHIRPPSLAEFREYLAAGPVVMMTLAPEQPGAMDLIREGSKRGVVMSAGHSNAKARDVSEAFLKGGLKLVTHVFNAMAPIHHRDETIATAALILDGLACEMIYDRHHLSLGTAILILKTKPIGSVVLVSDATAALEAPDGTFVSEGTKYVVEKGAIRVEGSGNLAGSAASLLQCVQRLVADTELPADVAVFMASGVPARVLGIERKKGFLRPGADADVILLDKKLEVRKTFVEGELLYERD